MKATRVSFTVKQLAEMAGVSVRTLHYYDEIGLLRPRQVGENGYRYYGQEELLRLQQILFFRELDFRLEQIKAILQRPDFDLLAALESHRRALRARVTHLETLIETVDRTVQHLKGEITMSQKDFYSGFDEAQQKQWAEEATRRWGETAASSQKRWEAMSREEKNAMLARMNEINEGLVASMAHGPHSPEAQAWIDRWYQHINSSFYQCSLEMFEGLGRMYNEDPAFQATYENMRPGMAAFMEQAMLHYVATRRA